MRSTRTKLGNLYHGGGARGHVVFAARVLGSEADRRGLGDRMPVTDGEAAPSYVRDEHGGLSQTGPEEIAVQVPWDDLVELVLDHLRSERIGALEQAEGGELLRLLGMG